jgi:hypothetical protein
MERCSGGPQYDPLPADKAPDAQYHPAMRLMGIRTGETLIGRSWSFAS